MLVTTDNHLGYKEEDPILKMDSFENFQSALEIGKENGVDAVIQLGDLFHIPEPSNRTLHLTINILEKTLGRAEVKGDYLDLSNMETTAIPLIMINGNHDRPN